MMQLLWAAFLVSGLTGKIQGEVRDEATGQPIPYANVVILNTEIGALTGRRWRRRRSMKSRPIR